MSNDLEFVLRFRDEASQALRSVTGQMQTFAAAARTANQANSKGGTFDASSIKQAQAAMTQMASTATRVTASMKDMAAAVRSIATATANAATAMQSVAGSNRSMTSFTNQIKSARDAVVQLRRDMQSLGAGDGGASRVKQTTAAINEEVAAEQRLSAVRKSRLKENPGGISRAEQQAGLAELSKNAQRGGGSGQINDGGPEYIKQRNDALKQAEAAFRSSAAATQQNAQATDKATTSTTKEAAAERALRAAMLLRMAASSQDYADKVRMQAEQGKATPQAMQKAQQAATAMKQYAKGSISGDDYDQKIKELPADLEKVSNAAGHARGGTAMLTREFIVLSHEVVSGNWTRVPGTLMVIASWSGIATAGMLGLAGAIGVVGGAIGAVIYKNLQAMQQMRELTTQAQLTGNPINAGQARQQSLSIAAQGPNSSADVFNTYRQFATQNNVRGINPGKFTSTAQNLGLAQGKDIGQAGEELQKVLEDGYAGIVRLNQAYPTFNQNELDHFRDMTNSGNVAGASAQAFKGFADTLSHVTDSLSSTQKGFAQLGVALDRFFESPVIQKLLGSVTGGAAGMLTTGAAALGDKNAQIQLLQQQIDTAKQGGNFDPVLMKAGIQKGGRSGDAYIASLQKRIDDLQAQIDQDRAANARKIDYSSKGAQRVFDLTSQGRGRQYGDAFDLGGQLNSAAGILNPLASQQHAIQAQINATQQGEGANTDQGKAQLATLQQDLARVTIQANTEIARQTALFSKQAEGSQKVADAFQQSYAAGIKAEQVAEANNNVVRTGTEYAINYTAATKERTAAINAFLAAQAKSASFDKAQQTANTPGLLEAATKGSGALKYQQGLDAVSAPYRHQGVPTGSNAENADIQNYKTQQGTDAQTSILSQMASTFLSLQASKSEFEDNPGATMSRLQLRQSAAEAQYSPEQLAAPVSDDAKKSISDKFGIDASTISDTKSLVDYMEKYEEEVNNSLKLMQAQKQVMQDLGMATGKMKADYQVINDLAKEGTITQQQAADERTKLNDEMLSKQKDLSSGMQLGVDQFYQNASNSAKIGQTLISGSVDIMTTMFTGWFSTQNTGWRSWALGVANAMEQVSQEILKLIVQQQLVMPLMQALGFTASGATPSTGVNAADSGGFFSFLGSLFGGSSGSLVANGTTSSASSTLLAAANGAVFAGMKINKFANGNPFTNSVVSSPTMAPMAMFGEAGDEAIMPLVRNSQGRLGVSSAGGGISGGSGGAGSGMNVNYQPVYEINIDNSGNATSTSTGNGSTGTTSSQASSMVQNIDSKVRQLVVSELQNQQRSGGILNQGARQ